MSPKIITKALAILAYAYLCIWVFNHANAWLAFGLGIIAAYILSIKPTLLFKAKEETK